MTTETDTDDKSHEEAQHCGECDITIYDVSYSDENGTGYLNPKRCPLCGGHLD